MVGQADRGDSPSLEDDFDHDNFTLILEWIDCMPLTRVKRNLNRDFADGVLVAEVIHYELNQAKVFQLVEKHNYQGANSSENKKANWELLRHKVFRKLDLCVTDREIQDFISAKELAIERFLMRLRPALDAYIKKRRSQANSKETAHFSTPGYPRYERHGGPMSLNQGDSARGSNAPGNSKQMAAPGNYDMLPSWVKMDLSDKDQKLAAAEETIQILSTKVKKLERLVHLKDIRINQLERGEGAMQQQQMQ